jgi:hypothetical protein
MSEQEHSAAQMPIDRFAAILDAYGAEARRWPAAERAAAESLLAASAEAQALQAQAAQLDQLLTASVAPAPSAALRAAILQVAPRGAGNRPAGAAETLRGLWQALLGTLTGELGGWRPAGAVLGVALLLGVAAGGTVETQSGTTSSTAATEQSVDFVQLALFDDLYSEF